MTNKTEINIEDIKKDIETHESLKSRFIKDSNYMLFFMSVSVLFLIYWLLMSKFILSFCFFIIAFLCLRRYNISMGKAEVHNGITKFLKQLLIQEQTGEDVFKNIVG